MADSSDSEEFYDAEEFTPIKGSKRSSVCSKSLSVNEEKDKETSPKAQHKETSSQNTAAVHTTAPAQDDNSIIKNVVQDRRRFQELRRCLQTEEDDETPESPGELDQHSCNLEQQPFKVIAHDAMSLQSMTSLGRIGRILSGAYDSQSNFKESVPPAPSTARELSTQSDDPVATERTQIAVPLACSEPDVIASTKANSLKWTRGGLTVTSPLVAQPVAPPRRKKRNKLHGSQSLSTTDGDNLSVCTNDTDDYYFNPPRKSERADKPPPLDALLSESQLSSLCPQQSLSLPSPASTIESLTREFQDSLELSHTKFESSPSVSDARESRRSTERPSNADKILDINDALHGVSVVSASDEDRSRAAGARTHSETRHTAPATDNRSSWSRRRSAGDEAVRPLTDTEILDQVTVLNLDTGERMPLSEAEHKLPQCINPLSLHIMRLTSEYIGRDNDDENASPVIKTRSSWRTLMGGYAFSALRKHEQGKMRTAISDITINIQNRETDEECESVCAGGAEDEAKESKREATDRQRTGIKKKTERETDKEIESIPIYHPIQREEKARHEFANDRLKRFFGTTVKKTVDAAKSLAQEVTHARHKEDVADIADDVRGEHNIKLKASNSHKGPYDFDGCVRHVQELGSAHVGAVWCCKFSVCGQLLATAGQDRLLRVWVTRDAHHAFQELRTNCNAEQKCSPTPSQESLPSAAPPSPDDAPMGPSAIFCPKPFCVYSGHTSDLLDVSWSKNNFILSSSMDKTVRLWHISRNECLCCFQHIDFVTAIVFHPRDDCYFLSGSLDGKLRLWNIPDKKVEVWNEVDGKTKLITAANFFQNGKFAVVGTYDGRCIFYTADQLKYHTQIDVRSTRGKNSTGRKISGVEPMPNDDKILVTSNDSRIRLYDLRDLNLSCKYKGYVNVSSQIKASFSHDGKYIVSGSENQCIYIWKTHHDYSKFTSVRRDRNDFWEGIKAHNAVVTCAVFAPNPDHMIRMISEREEEERARLGTSESDRDEVRSQESGGMVSSSQTGHVLVSADFNGCIKVFVHKAKPKHSSLPASALC